MKKKMTMILILDSIRFLIYSEQIIAIKLQVKRDYYLVMVKDKSIIMIFKFRNLRQTPSFLAP